MRKVPQKIIKILKWTGISLLGILLLVISGSSFLLKTSWGRNFSGNLFSSLITSKTGNRVEIGNVYIGLREIILKEVFFYDDHDKILFSCKEARLSLKKLSQSGNKVIFPLANLDGLVFNTIRYPDKTDYDITNIVNRIKARLNKTGGEPRKIIFRKITANNAEFHLNQIGTSKKSGKIDFLNFAILKINAELSDLEILGSNIRFKVERFEAVESTGLNINSLKASVELDTNKMFYNEIDIRTPLSRIKGDIRFSFFNYKDFQQFIPKVRLEGRLNKTTVSFEELTWFAKKIPTDLGSFEITGEAEGVLENLKCKNVTLNFGERSFFKGNAKVTGIPVVSEMLMDVTAKKSNFSLDDIRQLIPNLKIPEKTEVLGDVQFTGRYTGFFRDFVTYGNINTALGNAKTDLNLKINPATGIASYSGNIAMDGFDLGSLVHTGQQIGKISCTGSVSGKGLSRSTIDAIFDIQASLLEFNRYPYQGINFKGHLVKTDFDGGVIINDPNINLDFNGKIDLSTAKPEFRYKASLKKADLHKLNFLAEKFILDCNMDINLKAGSPDDAEGKIKINNARLQLAKADYHFDSLMLFSVIRENIKNIRIRSDIANADLNGNFNITDLPVFLKQTLYNYLDSSFEVKTNKKLQGQFLSFNIDLPNNEVLNQLFRSKVQIDNSAHLEGFLSYGQKNNISLSFPGISFAGLEAKNWKISVVSHDSQSLAIKSTSEKFLRKDSILGENISISANSVRDSAEISLSFENKRLRSLMGLNGRLWLKKDSIEITLSNSNLTTDNTNWDIKSGKITIRYLPEIKISYLELKNPRESIKILGEISPDRTKSLRVLPDNLDLDHITTMINNKKKFDFSGKVNGQLLLYNLFGLAYFDAAAVISPLVYRNSDTLGILNIVTSYNENSNKNNIMAAINNVDLDELLSLNGEIDFNKKKNLDLELNMPETDVRFLQPFLRGLFSELKGMVKGKIAFTGSVDAPDVKGIFNFTNSSFRLDYMNTTYFFDADLNVNNKTITASNVKLKDQFGIPATLSGMVKHDFFRNFYFDLLINAQNLYAMNLSEQDNSIFHGQAWASGSIKIIGPPDKIKMDMQLEANENTKFFLTTYGTVTSGQYPYIRFTNRTDRTSYKQNVSTRGVVMNLNIEATPESEIQLLFNPEVSDMIKARGSGNIKVEIDNLGNLNMYGVYTIEDGEYLFTSMSVFKRTFKVTNGGTITWSGDPINAKIDIEALYKIDASVADLLRESGNVSDKDINTTVPVQAKIILSGLLYSPDIKLDFDILNSKSLSGNYLGSFDQKIRYIKNDEQELNKQVIGLLVMQKFLPVTTGIQATSAINEGISSNVGTLISTQVSNWISQFSSNFDSKYISDLQFGVNYSADSRLYQKELELVYSSNFLDNRINISGSYDIENINNNFEASYLFKNNKMRFKIFSRSDNNPIYHQNINRQGLGIFFRKDFETLGEFFRRSGK